MEYDYIKCVEVLEGAGAKKDLANNNGHAAAVGIEGTKVRDGRGDSCCRPCCGMMAPLLFAAFSLVGDRCGPW